MTCSDCSGYPWECTCAAQVVSKSPEGWPLDKEGTVVMSQCTQEMKREIYRKLIPRPQFMKRQAGG